MTSYSTFLLAFFPPPHFHHLFPLTLFYNQFLLFLSHLAEGCRSPTGNKLLIKVKASPAEQTETWGWGSGVGYAGPLPSLPNPGFMIIHVRRLAYEFYLIDQISLMTKNCLTAKVKVPFPPAVHKPFFFCIC